MINDKLVTGDRLGSVIQSFNYLVIQLPTAHFQPAHFVFGQAFNISTFNNKYLSINFSALLLLIATYNIDK